jgi:hypothetical protein
MLLLQSSTSRSTRSGPALKAHPDEWPFASHRAHAGLDAHPIWLESLNQLGLFPNATSYRETIDAAVRATTEIGSGQVLTPGPGLVPTAVEL